MSTKSLSRDLSELAAASAAIYLLPPDRAFEMSKVLEDRLGLRLQSEKSVRVDMIVIDRAEEPSPN